MARRLPLQIVYGDSATDARVVEFGLLGAQTDLYVAQAFAIGQLREGHAQILIEILEALDRVTAPIARDAAPEAIKGKVVDQLRENDLAQIHEPSPD